MCFFLEEYNTAEDKVVKKNVFKTQFDKENKQIWKQYKHQKLNMFIGYLNVLQAIDFAIIMDFISAKLYCFHLWANSERSDSNWANQLLKILSKLWSNGVVRVAVR